MEVTRISGFDFDVRLVLDAGDDEHPYVDQIEIVKRERGPAVTATALRQLPLAEILERTTRKAAETAELDESGDDVIRYPQSRRPRRDELTRAVRRARPKTRVLEDELRLAAQAAAGAPPRARVKSVMKALDCNEQTAVRRIRAAREAGYRC